jgi:hypothetical protein
VPIRTIALVFTACFLVLLSPFSSFAQTKCPEFPKVDFWGELTHDLARQHVADNFDGNWGDYVDKLKRQHAALSRISGRGKAARVSRGGLKVVLRGANLSQYLSLSQQRIEVIECLRSQRLSPLKQFPRDPLSATIVNDETVKRTYLTLPKKLLDKLRLEAVRRSKEENRKVGVNEVILDTVREELNRGHR